VIDAPIGRHPSDRTRMAIVRRGREARTSYAVLAAGETRALLRLRLYTGRTHQARVHLAAIGAPVSGDAVYGSAAAHRQLLHAWRLAVPHPGGGTLEATSPMPADMAGEVRRMGFEALASEYSAPVPARLRDGAPGSEA
jgi:23S rRNA pseudouridine1911/1915/1917 synthase